jgi:hypothetical protein
MNTTTLNSIKSIKDLCGISKYSQYDYPIKFTYEEAKEVKKALTKIEKYVTNPSLRAVMVNTTAYGEEDFMLVTNLTDKQIKDVIKPIVEAERNDEGEDNFYDNDALFWALKDKYPHNIVDMYTEQSMNNISI